jgi:hypothetical protein
VGVFLSRTAHRRGHHFSRHAHVLARVGAFYRISNELEKHNDGT